MIFLPNGTPFKNETERAAILERLREGIKAKHAASYKAWKVQLAGVETQRLRFVENGQTIFYLLPHNGEQIFTIIVTVPRPYAPFPNEVNTLLASLKLSGPAHNPSQKVGSLHRRSARPDKLNERLDGLLEARAKRKKSGTKPTYETSHTTGTNTHMARRTDTATTKSTDRAVTGAGDTKVPKRPPKGLPVVTFSASDPCAVLKTTSEEGMPWKRVPGTSDRTLLPTVHVGKFNDLTKISKSTYNGAVAMAMEGMRILYGPLDEHTTRAFEAAWVPLFDHPSQEVLEYLDRLIPLLAKFLALREAWMQAGTGFMAAMLDVSLSVAAEQKAAWLDAMERADQQVLVMRILENEMEALARAIEALGNPPNPLADKCASARRYRRSLPRPESALDGEWVSSDGSSRIY
ncbi:MAG: hypothetical protein ACUVTG_12320 [Candidatus Oleimicrobiaceae bacterium]